ncbi:hypothetical protein Hanom_Chr10g00935551 [Helianthus anomalus]
MPKQKSKLQNSSFMFVTYYKLCPLSLIFTRNILDVCKPLQVMSFTPNIVSLKSTPYKGILVILPYLIKLIN